MTNVLITSKFVAVNNCWEL